MSGLELYHGNDEVLNLATGQILNLADATLDELAEARERLSELWHTRTTAAMMIDAELVRRADTALAAGEDFGRTQRFTIAVDGGNLVTYPSSNAMRAELMRLAMQGELPISREAVERAFTVAEYRLDVRAWRKLLDRFPALRDVDERFGQRPRRGTRVKRLELIEGTATEVHAA